MIAMWSVETTPVPDDEDFRNKLLWAAVLRLAVVDWVTTNGNSAAKKKRLFREADVWLFRDEREIFHDDGITFRAVCRMLELDPAYIRGLIREMTVDQIRAAKMSRGLDD